MIWVFIYLAWIDFVDGMVHRRKVAMPPLADPKY